MFFLIYSAWLTALFLLLGGLMWCWRHRLGWTTREVLLVCGWAYGIGLLVPHVLPFWPLPAAFLLFGVLATVGAWTVVRSGQKAKKEGTRSADERVFEQAVADQVVAEQMISGQAAPEESTVERIEPVGVVTGSVPTCNAPAVDGFNGMAEVLRQEAATAEGEIAGGQQITVPAIAIAQDGEHLAEEAETEAETEVRQVEQAEEVRVAVEREVEEEEEVDEKEVGEKEAVEKEVVGADEAREAKEAKGEAEEVEEVETEVELAVAAEAATAAETATEEVVEEIGVVVEAAEKEAAEKVEAETGVEAEAEAETEAKAEKAAEEEVEVGMEVEIEEDKLAHSGDANGAQEAFKQEALKIGAAEVLPGGDEMGREDRPGRELKESCRRIVEAAAGVACLLPPEGSAMLQAAREAFAAGNYVAAVGGFMAALQSAGQGNGGEETLVTVSGTLWPAVAVAYYCAGQREMAIEALALLLEECGSKLGLKRREELQKLLFSWLNGVEDYRNLLK